MDVMEYVESIVQLIATLVALLMSLFRYISTKKRGWLYVTGYFTSSLLSSYFWTSYLIIMDDSPNASNFLTYLGWNIGYLILVLLNIHVKTREERRYLTPLMILPLLVNIPQLMLYVQFDGVIMSIYQVTICTVTACLCVQGTVWYIKHRKEDARVPYIAIATLVNLVAEFGMWTASCYEGWADKVYYLSSFVCSLSYLLIVWAAKKYYIGDEDVIIDRRMQKMLKLTYVSIVMICSIGGIFLGRWIKETLTQNVSESAETSVYDIITVILFLISIILVALALAIIMIVYFEQKLTENHRLREEKRVAEQSNAAKSDFLANMSHEIRTPINAVLGMNKMIIRESIKARNMPPADGAQASRVFSDITGYAANIDSAGNNLLSIINDILDFSKIEAGRLELAPREYNISSVLNDVSNTVLFKAGEKGLDFIINTDDTLPEGLYGDDVRLRQIMINVLGNAVKYTDKGSVTLSVHGGGGVKTGETTELIIDVADTGIGIKQEDISKIFDKFERTDMEHNSSVEGTGLGLAITHHLLAMMGGRIDVKSEYGKGSVFTVRIPQKVTDEQPIGNFHERFEKSIDNIFESENLFTAPDAHILIVDDTQMNLTVAAGLLKDTLINTDVALSGEQALRLTLGERYDIILMDQRMPGMDGTQTLKLLREQEKQNGIKVPTPVICLTADAISGAKEHYIAEGFDDYLSKPIDSVALKRLLMKYLPEDKLLPYTEGVKKTADADAAYTEQPGGGYAVLCEAGIDVNKGLGYCQNNDELYRMLIGEYVRSAQERAVSLRDFFENHDAKNYSIIVHSLKSTSRTIGADEVAELAAALEKAAGDENWDFISENHAVLIEKYTALIDKLSAYADVSQEQEDDEIIEFFPE